MLQLALVAASREIIPVRQFFSNLSFIINIICGSCKRHDELKVAKTVELAHLKVTDKLETGKGANQIFTLSYSAKLETRLSILLCVQFNTNVWCNFYSFSRYY